MGRTRDFVVMKKSGKSWWSQYWIIAVALALLLGVYAMFFGL